MTQSFILVAVGGALGAVCRYGIGLFALHSITQNPNSVFPWATLGINIAGSFAIGLLWSLFADATWFQEWGRPLLIIGLLGGFTTFSAFSMETLTLFNSDKLWAATYVLSSVLGCLMAVATGFWLGSFGFRI